ncbi:uncharacterized protein LOC105193525 [Solenopsis invicta]|uniref:uncharacterized protein LOC105193525 n=1 Tax=Solenopsis invicta TaxID=13686 RepID=UPI0005962D1A|nr:uncharacterized protein LOC105193525 [Solenopsis invicta]XP_025991471.1 uncharacterized protein LOC105193525 [Solenopsis invicta]XP_039307506.1 uncharacterized protein LOC105193525 [Solenopsis invicta]
MEEKATTDSSSQSTIGDNNQTDKKDLHLTTCYNEVSTEQLQTQFTCSLYISRVAGLQTQDQGEVQDCELLRSHLEEAIAASEPLSTWRVSETPCGLIAAFARENDAEKLLQRGNLAQVFRGPVQVARFSARDSRYRQAVLLRDVPWAIPLQDINSALTKQGIVAGNVERSRQFVRVEVFDAGHYEALLRQGLDFFEVARFNAIPERWWRSGGTACSSGIPSRYLPGNNGSNFLEAHQDNLSQTADSVLQCYRCQGFWHVAANCRHLPRCVRCGEPHSVEFCPRPRNNPICCHCSGPHHAGYRQCPVRLQLSNATPVSITLSTTRTGGVQYPTGATSKSNPSCHSLRQGHC